MVFDFEQSEEANFFFFNFFATNRPTNIVVYNVKTLPFTHH